MTGKAPQDIDSIPIAGDDEEAPPPSPPPKEAKRRRRRALSGRWVLLLWLLLPLLLYFLGTLVLLPWAGPPLAGKYLSARLAKEVRVARMRVHPFTLEFSLYNLLVSDPASPAGEPLFSLARLTCDLEAASLLKRQWIIKKCDLVEPHLQLRKEQDGTYNLTLPSPERMTSFAVSNFTLTKGRIDYQDLAGGSSYRITGIELKLPVLANIHHKADQLLEPKFSAVVNGSPVQLTGTTRLTEEGLSAELAVKVDSLAITDYLGILPFPVKAMSGLLSVDGELVVGTNKDGASIALAGGFTIKDLDIQDEGLRLTAALLKLNGRIEPFARKAAFEEVELASPALTLADPRRFWDLLGESAEPQAISTEKLLVVNGEILFGLGKGSTKALTKIQASVSRLEPAVFDFAMGGVLAGASRLNIQGKWVDGQGQGLLVADRLKGTDVSPFFPDVAAFLGRSVISDLSCGFRMLPGKDVAPDLSFSNIQCTFPNGIQAKGFACKGLSVRHAALLPKKKSIHLGEIVLESPSFDQASNLQVFPPGWKVDYRSVTVHNGTLRARPAFAAGPVTLSAVTATFHAEPGEERSQGTARLAQGTLTWEGSFSRSPFAADLHLVAEKLPLGPLLAEPGKKNIIATLSGEGRFLLPQGSVTGDFTLAEIRIADGGSDPFKAGRITVTRGTLDLTSRRLAAASLRVTNADLLWEPGKGFQGLPLQVDASQLAVEESRITFRDRKGKTVTDLVVADMTGTVASINDQPGVIQVDLAGTIAGKAKVVLKGRVPKDAPARPEELHLSVRGLRATAGCAYLAEIFGASPSGGTVTYTAKITRRSGQLFARLIIEAGNIGFADPGAASPFLPLTLALIEDNHQSFTLESETQGTALSRELFLRPLARRWASLTARSAADPFTVVAEQFPGVVRELGFVPGSAELPDDVGSLLAGIKKLLRNRPKLGLTVQAVADPSCDRKALLAAKEQERAARARLHAARLSQQLAKTYGSEEIKEVPLAPPPLPPVTVTERELMELAEQRMDNFLAAAQKELKDLFTRVVTTPPSILDPLIDAPCRGGIRLRLRRLP